MPSTLAQQKIQSLFSQDELLALLSLVEDNVQYETEDEYISDLNQISSKLKLLVKQNGPNYHG
jgi:hypothetical protein